MTPDRRQFLCRAGIGALGIAVLGACGEGGAARAAERFPVRMSDAAWRKRLGAASFAVLRRAATEPPFSSPLDAEYRAGTYACKGCDNPLYASRTKFDSGTGWPSFWAPLPHAIGTRVDRSLLMARVEVHCARCGGHLGHVFADGPPPTGKRYCMNGLALVFRPA